MKKYARDKMPQSQTNLPGTEKSETATATWGLNKEWHLKNLMPKNPTFEERVAWHLAHRTNCSCRPIPDKLLEEMKKRGVAH